MHNKHRYTAQQLACCNVHYASAGQLELLYTCEQRVLQDQTFSLAYKGHVHMTGTAKKNLLWHTSCKRSTSAHGGVVVLCFCNSQHGL